jgi:hypothetical protein
MRHAIPSHPYRYLDRGVKTTPSNDRLRLAEVQRLHVDILIAELADLEAKIRLQYPGDDVTRETEVLEPTIVQLVEAEYRILRELRRRQTLLRQAIRWTTL